MNITNDHIKTDFKKPEMEQVEQEKQEYKLIGKFRRTAGLNLYCYNHIKNEVQEIETSHKKTVQLDDALNPEGLASEEATIDARFEHFEALNMKNAEKRVRKFKEGKITELNNLKKPAKNGIKIF